MVETGGVHAHSSVNIWGKGDLPVMKRIRLSEHLSVKIYARTHLICSLHCDSFYSDDIDDRLKT